MKSLALAAVTVAAMAIATDARAAFIDCDILGGQPVACQNGFDGTAVVDDHGRFRECTFRDGKPVSCEAKRFDGRALVSHEGIYQMCDVADGQVYRCVAWAQGRAPRWEAEANQPLPVLNPNTIAKAKGTLAPAAKAPATKVAKSPAKSKKKPVAKTANRPARGKDNPT